MKTCIRLSKLFSQYKVHADVEIQQRACEYSAINSNVDENLIESVFEVMPAFERDQSDNMLLKRVETQSKRRIVEEKGEKAQITEDEDEDDEDEDEDEEVEEVFEDQTKQELQALLQSASGSGYLYSSPLLQIGVKMQVGTGHEMKMKIFYGNKSTLPIEELSCSFGKTPDATVSLVPNDPITVEAKKQERQFLRIQCHRPMATPLGAVLRFTLGGEENDVHINFPIIVTQFIKSHLCSGKKFVELWKSWTHEAKTIVDLASNIEDIDSFKESLSNQLHCKIVDMSGIVAKPKTVLCLAGIFEATRKGTSNEDVLRMPILVRFQLKRSAFQVAVKSQSGALSSAIMASVKLIHEKL
mmetsp:Transcript_45349/g.72949  ORF Transcript_45349/g.72949 Transcript_45349/m.72949 type:complete len:356 (-) Transcript_45349:231-1298(-)